jgi:hypothetical protein
MISHIRTNIFGYIIRTVHNGIAAGVITLDGLGAASASLASNAGGAELGVVDQFRPSTTARPPAKAVDFLILDDLAAERGPPRKRTLFPVACRHAWGRTRQMWPVLR